MHRNLTRVFAGLAVLSLLPLGGCDSDEVDLNGPGVKRYGVNWELADAAPKQGGGVDLEVGETRVDAPKTSSSSKKGATATPAKRRSKKKGKGTKYKPMTVEGGGTISGTITLASAPTVKDVKLDRDTAKCGHESHPSERCVFDPKTLTLANCVVRLLDVKTGKAWTGPMAEKKPTAVLDQKACKYIPHVKVVRAGTKMKFGNSDNTEHNIHGYFGSFANTWCNITTPAGAEPMSTADTKMKKPGKYIVKCDIHPWMNAYLHAVTNPYFAVTGTDGQFTISDVPPGKYTLEVWHESIVEVPVMGTGGKISSYNYGDDWVETREIEVKAGETATADFKMPVGK